MSTSDDGNKPILTMDMIRAGVRALKSWNPEVDEIEAAVVHVYFEMLEAEKLRAIHIVQHK